jgi:hypothetical protein
MACDANPITQFFSPSRDRILFRWDKPHQSRYLGRLITENGGDVISFDDVSVTRTRDHEPIRDAQGHPITWTYHVMADKAGFCVSRSDVQGNDCLVRYVRCDGPVPTS